MSPQADSESSLGVRGRGPDPRAARSRAAALAATRELLAEQGWSAVTHVAVAARSGVGRTTLYRHWPDATALIQDTIAQEISIASPEPTGELREDLTRTLDALRVMLHEPLTERSLRAIIERADVDPAYTQLKETLYHRGSAPLRSIVETAKAHGELPPQLDTDLAVDQLAGPLMFRRLVAGDSFTTDYVRQVVDGFVRAYANGPR
jgi:AcrR family transcriptional regulator